VIANFDGVTADVVLERLFNSENENIRYNRVQAQLTVAPRQEFPLDVLWDVYSLAISTES
jgi:hypothetical protein